MNDLGNEPVVMVDAYAFLSPPNGHARIIEHGVHHHPCSLYNCRRMTMCDREICAPEDHKRAYPCDRCKRVYRELQYIQRYSPARHRRSHCTQQEKDQTQRGISDLEVFMRHPHEQHSEEDRHYLVGLAKLAIADLWTHNCIYGMGSEAVQ